MPEIHVLFIQSGGRAPWEGLQPQAKPLRAHCHFSDSLALGVIWCVFLVFLVAVAMPARSAPHDLV